jgi:hypothetical protein
MLGSKMSRRILGAKNGSVKEGCRKSSSEKLINFAPYEVLIL